MQAKYLNIVKEKFLSIALLFCFTALAASAQVQSSHILTHDVLSSSSSWVDRYVDSLNQYKEKMDTVKIDSDNIYQEKLFVLIPPLTYFSKPIRDFLDLNVQSADTVSDGILNRALMNIYLNYPGLVAQTEKTLADQSIKGLESPKIREVHPNMVERVSPKPMEPDIISMGVYLKKPNFWTLGGDYYLQFLQNYVSNNWYKGGESSYSMLGSVDLQVNYNNKQKVKWDNELELKLGYQASKDDSLHKYKTSEDLIRYTSKLGLQATKKWYYTLQMIAYTQFTKGFKSNDDFVYSNFMSPFNLNLSLGMDYNVNWLNKKLTGTIHLAPLALNWKYVKRLSLSTNYGLDEGKHTLLDYGSEFTFDLGWKISDMISWKTRMYGYTTYRRTEFEWENTIVFKFNQYISTNLFIYPGFDDGASRDEHHGYLQLKEYASLGFSYSF